MTTPNKPIKTGLLQLARFRFATHFSKLLSAPYWGVITQVKMYRPGIFKWFDEAKLKSLINGEVEEVVKALEEQNVIVESGGLWNVKAPDPVLFTNKAFEVSSILRGLAADNNNIILKEGYIGFQTRRLSVVFEE